MDIRNWFVSKGSAVSTKSKNASEVTNDKKTKKSVKASKRRRVISDSDSDNESSSKKERSSPRKIQTKQLKSQKNSTSPGKKNSSLNEDNSDFDSPKNKVSKKPLLRVSSKVSETEKKVLKVASVADFFGSSPVERSFKKTPKQNQKEINTKVELNHDDDDFNKTLLQLEPEMEVSSEYNKKETLKNKETVKHKQGKQINAENKTSVESKTEIEETKTSPKRKEKKRTRHLSSDIEVDPSPDFTTEIPKQKDVNSTKESKRNSTSTKKLKTKSLSSDIEFEPSPKIIEKKKEVIKETPPKKEKKKGGNSANYMSYLHRDGPRALGSKEIPEGEEGCLEGMTFIVTGVLESITRDETKEIIEGHGGKLMSTLSKNTKYIIVGRDAGPSKLEKAEKLGTKQLTEDGLFELVKNTPGKGPKKVKLRSKLENSSFNDSSSFLDESQIEDDTELQNADLANKQSPKKTKEKEVNEEVSKSTKIDTAGENAPKVVHKLLSSPEMWVDKYKPTSLKQLIGQQDANSNAKKLLKWLENWHRNTKNKKPAVAGRWNTNDGGAGFKAALLSGPPGVGKTTTSQLVCKEAGFDFLELNASDTRSKKSLQAMASEVLQNQSLAGCFKDGTNGSTSKNHAIIMDEVDGMAGNQDRGGIQELISFIKSTKIPIICICNDRNHPKMRSLANYCFDLRFQRPRVEQIKGAMMSVAFKEGIKVTPPVLHDIITASNQDIRQVLHNLSVWSVKDKSLSIEQAKADIGHGTKHIKMGPFDVLREVFTIGQKPNVSINDKANLFFHDYSIAPLFVQENYVHVSPAAAANNKAKHMQLLSECADSICNGDIVEKQIRNQGSWNLLPIEAIFASVIPGDLMMGNLRQMINFPAWLGKNSNRKHMDRILQELQVHMRMRTTGNKTEVAMDYLPLLKHSLTNPLLVKEAEGVPDVLKIMDYYCLLREDFDSIVELSLWSNQTDPRTKISPKVKSAFTRAYNKECAKNPYSTSAISKKKKSAKDFEGDLLNEDGSVISEDESEDDDKLENDAMIKVKKPTKAAASTKGSASTSTKANKTSKRGRNK